VNSIGRATQLSLTLTLPVQQNAFVLNFKTTGNPAPVVNPLYSRALANMDPLYSASGLDNTNEFGWSGGVNKSSLILAALSHGVHKHDRLFLQVCVDDNAVGRFSQWNRPTMPLLVVAAPSFVRSSTPNLSFWRLLPISGRSTARPLPVFDRGMALNRSKTYVLLETNEGDTPRIVVSAFSRSWTDPRRGSLPVSWSIDPV